MNDLKSKSLVQLVDESTAIERMLIESDGEITPEIEAALAIKDTHLPHNVDSYSLMIDRLESVARFYKEKADFFAQLSKQCTNGAARLKENIKYAMRVSGETEMAGFDIRFKLSKSNPKLVIDDESKIDKAYTTLVTETVINKDRIKEDLKIGVPVPGAHLEESVSLRVYANSSVKSKKAGA